MKDPRQFVDEAGRLRRWLIEQAEALAAAFDADEAAAVLQAVANRCSEALKLRELPDPEDPPGESYCDECGLLPEDCECIAFEDTRTHGHADTTPREEKRP